MQQNKNQSNSRVSDISNENHKEDDEKEFKRRILSMLSQVYDPEIPVNIVDLGLIYDLNVDFVSKKIKVLMTLTSPTCPLSSFIVSLVEDKLKKSFKTFEPEIELTFNPLWTPEKIKTKARQELNL